jgi:hypothetical protein
VGYATVIGVAGSSGSRSTNLAKSSLSTSITSSGFTLDFEVNGLLSVLWISAGGGSVFVALV